MVFFLFGFFFKKHSSISVGIMALIFSIGIEFSQIYQADWINYLRSFKIGGLILGYGFLWSDLICYSVGIIIGILIEKFVFAKNLL